MTAEVIQALFSITVAVTNDSTSLLINSGLSGLMGLSFNVSSELQVTSFWETLWLHNLQFIPGLYRVHEHDFWRNILAAQC
jgi:hypothetical protein